MKSVRFSVSTIDSDSVENNNILISLCAYFVQRVAEMLYICVAE